MVDYPQKQIDRLPAFCQPSWLSLVLLKDHNAVKPLRLRYMKFGRNQIKMTKLWLSFVSQNPYSNLNESLMKVIHI